MVFCLQVVFLIQIVYNRNGREDSLRLVEKYKLNVPLIADREDQISRLYKISGVPMWRNVKRNQTHNRYFPTFEALVTAVEAGLS